MTEELLQERLVVANDTRYLSEVRDFISRMTERSLLTPEDANRVILAVDEAISNIIEHAYEDHTEGTIEIEVVADTERFKVSIHDSGKLFNPTSVELPDIMEHVRKGKKKGLGIFLIRQIMDEVTYHYQEGVRNELVLSKYIRK